MRLKLLFLAGAALPAFVTGQNAASQSHAPLIFGQVQQDNQDNKGQRRDQTDPRPDQRPQQQPQERAPNQGQQDQRREQRPGQNERRDPPNQQRQQQQGPKEGQDQRRERNEQRQEQRQERQPERREERPAQPRQQQQSPDRQERQQPEGQAPRQEPQKQEPQNQEPQKQEPQKQDQQRQEQQRQEQQRQEQQRQEQPNSDPLREPQRRNERQRDDQQRRDGRQDRKEGQGEVPNNRRHERPESLPQGRQDGREQEGRRDDRARSLEEIRGERRERREGNRVIIQEGSRSIIREGNRTIIRRDESDRFRRLGRDVDVRRIGGETRTLIVGPNGARIVTVTDNNGRLIRRSRLVDGREVIIIDNRVRGPRRAGGFFIDLPPPVISIPRERYIVEAESAPAEFIYGALTAPPVERIARAYTLDEIRYSVDVRARMPRVDLDTVTFESGSWDVTPDQYNHLKPVADAITRAIQQNPNEVFLIEGHTDAVGTEDDNLSLSDRRAESVSVTLTDEFKIPPENLTTQGYGEQQLKVQTDGPERANRRVTIRRITPLLQGQAQRAPGGQSPRQ